MVYERLIVINFIRVLVLIVFYFSSNVQEFDDILPFLILVSKITVKYENMRPRALFYKLSTYDIKLPQEFSHVP